MLGVDLYIRKQLMLHLVMKKVNHDWFKLFHM